MSIRSLLLAVLALSSLYWHGRADFVSDSCHRLAVFRHSAPCVFGNRHKPVKSFVSCVGFHWIRPGLEFTQSEQRCGWMGCEHVKGRHEASLRKPSAGRKPRSAGLLPMGSEVNAEAHRPLVEPAERRRWDVKSARVDLFSLVGP